MCQELILSNHNYNLALIGNRGELGRSFEKNLSKRYKIYGNNNLKINSRKNAAEFSKNLPLCERIILCAGNTRYRCKTKNDLISHLEVVRWIDVVFRSIRPDHVLFVSSTSVYGENLEHKFTNEKKSPKPFTLYSKIKLKAENILAKKCKKLKLKLCIVRLPIIVGEDTNTSFPTPQNVKFQIKRGQNNYTIPSSMYPERPYLTINELSKIIFKLIKNKISGIYNIVPDQSIRLIDLCCEIRVPKKVVIKFSGTHLPLNQSFSNKKIKRALKIKRIKGLNKI